MIDSVWVVLCLQRHATVLLVGGAKFPGNPVDVIPGVDVQRRLIGKNPEQTTGVAVQQTSSWSVIAKQTEVIVKASNLWFDMQTRNSIAK